MKTKIFHHTYTNLAPVAVIARLTLLESLRNRLPWAVMLLAALGLGLAAFLEEVGCGGSGMVWV